MKEYKLLFKNFVKRYVDTGEEAFLMKVAHTGDVVSIISYLGKKLDLDSRQLKLAKLTALFHDLGRFVQFEKYRTFNDKISIDHSKESVAILDETGFLDDIPIEDQKLIKTAIIEHNKKCISDGLNPDELGLSLLIRDADKLSNFPILLAYYDKVDLPSNNHYRDDFIQMILSKIPIDNSLPKTIEDFYLYHLCWFNDLNYTASIEYAIQEEYINKILVRIADTNVKTKLKTYFDGIRIMSNFLQECQF